MYSAEKLKQINRKFIQLKLASYNANEYIYNYFSDLRNEVDLAANSELAANDNKDQIKESELTDNWIALIDQIKSYEKECLSSRTICNSIAEQVKAHRCVEMVNRKLNELNSQADKNEAFQNIDHLLDEEIYKIEKSLFCNKTMIFLDKNKCELKALFNKMNLNVTLGKLIFITNEYFGKLSIETLKRKFDYNPTHLSAEQLKLKCLKKRLLAEIKTDQIEEIRLDTSSLTKIDLSHNEYVTIEKSLFRNMKDLVKINLSNNKIASLDPYLFEGLNKLKEINLSSNELTYIHPATFNDLSSLRWIWLQNNNIETLDPNVFRDLTSLTYIHLDQNKIKTLDKKIFMGLKKLEVINLSNNRLTLIDKNLFSCLTNLDCIDLSNNKIKTVECDSFNGLSKLSHINLSYNRLHMLDTNLFDGLANLRAVYVNGNQLEATDKNLFKGLPIFWIDFYDLSDKKMQSKFFSFQN